MRTIKLKCKHGREWLVTWVDFGSAPILRGRYDCRCKP